MRLMGETQIRVTGVVTGWAGLWKYIHRWLRWRSWGCVLCLVLELVGGVSSSAGTSVSREDIHSLYFSGEVGGRGWVARKKHFSFCNNKHVV
jgi:hypothetical protein